MSPEASRGRRRPRPTRCRKAPKDRISGSRSLAAVAIAALFVAATLTALPGTAQDLGLDQTLEPSPAWNLSVERGVEALHLTWDPPNATPDRELSGYAIYRGETPDDLARHDVVEETTYDDVGLPDNATFHYRVNATYADASEGDGTQVRNGTTFARPSVPLNVSATAGPTPGNVTINWSAPADDGGTNLTAYQLTARNATGNVTNNWTLGANQTGLVHGNLSEGTWRNYTVAATNAAGTGNASEPVEATTWSRPGVPGNLQASTGPGAGEITLNWTAPAETGGTNLTAYVVYRQAPDGGFDPVANVHADVTEFVEVGLAPGTSYAYAVAARNAVGVGNRSDVVEATTYDLPSAPSLDAGTGPGIGNVTLTWSVPADDGGLPLIGYRIYRQVDGGWLEVAKVDADVTEHVDTGLSANTTFNYTVAAENDAGIGNQSDPASAETLDAPSAPVGVTAGTGPDLGEITVAWEAPTLDDASVVGYAIEVHQGGSWEDLTEVDAGTTEHVIGDLPPGARRILRVRTLADVGPGQASDPVEATTYGPPSAPTSLEIAVREGGLDLTWTPPTDGELNLTGFRVELRTGADGSFERVADLGPDATAYRDDDPTRGVDLTYRVIAANAAGESPPSETVTVSVAPSAGSGTGDGTDTSDATGSGGPTGARADAGTEASSIPLTGIGLVGALGLGVALVALAAVLTRPTEDEEFTVLGGTVASDPEPEVAATQTTVVPVAALPDPETFEPPRPGLDDRLREMTIPSAPEPLVPVRDRLQRRLQALRDHARAGRATDADVDGLARDADRFADLVETFETARRRVDATADAVAASEPATSDATAAGLRAALRHRAAVGTDDLDAAQARVDDLDRWSRRVADARDRMVAWSEQADADIPDDPGEATIAFWRRLVGRLLVRRRPEAGLADVLTLRTAARVRALERLETVETHVPDDARQALAARVAGALALVDALEDDDVASDPILDRLDEVADAGLFGPALAEIAADRAPAGLDELLARQHRISTVDLPRLVGAPTATAADPEVADRLAEVAARSSDPPREAIRAYAAGKTADLDDVDAWLIDAVVTAHALALPAGREGPGFDGAVVEAIRRDLERFDVVHRDRLARRLVTGGTDVDAVLEAMAEEGEVVLDEEAGLVGRPTEIDADRIHQLRRRHEEIPDDHLTAFIRTLESEGDDDA